MVRAWPSVLNEHTFCKISDIDIHSYNFAWDIIEPSSGITIIYQLRWTVFVVASIKLGIGGKPLKGNNVSLMLKCVACTRKMYQKPLFKNHSRDSGTISKSP